MVMEGLRSKLEKIPWRKVGWALLFSVLMVLSFVGGFLLMSWYFQTNKPRSRIEQDYSDWHVYKNEVYGFGLRYPKDWKVKKINPRLALFTPPVIAGTEKPPLEYIQLLVSSNKNRKKTPCERKQNQCSFYTNGIFGERTTSPEREGVFFSHGKDDFTFTLYKYDSPAEVVASYLALFEAMAGSFRFTSEVTNGCEKDADCVLGIRLDQCCSCAQTFSKSEVEANVTIAAFDPDKDYSGEGLADCSSVVCDPCPTAPSGAVCVSNRCQIKE